MALAVQDGMLNLQTSQPAKIDLTLTKEGYSILAELFNKSKFIRLDKPADISGILTQVKIPVILNTQPRTLIERFPTIQGNFADIRLQAKVAIDSLSLSEVRSGNHAYLKYLTFTVDKASAKEPIQLHLDGRISSQARMSSTPSKEGTVSLDAQLNHLFDPAGQFDKQSMVVNIQGDFNNVPTLMIDLFNQESKMSRLLGSTFNLNLNTQIQQLSGPVSLTLQAPNTCASLNGQLKNGTLYLLEPIYTQVNLTPSVSKYILGSANPLSITQISSDNPLTLQVDPQGFAIPLFPFQLDQMSLGKTRIELGKIRCTNDGTLNFTLGLLKSDRLTSENELLIWFAPPDGSSPTKRDSNHRTDRISRRRNLRSRPLGNH